MNITTILIIVNVFAAITMIALTLMQSSKSDMGSAFGGGGSQSMFGSRGSSNFLSKSTALMCAVFFVSSIALAYTYAKRNQANTVESSVIEQVSEVPSIEVPSIDLPNVDTSGQVPSLNVEQLENSVPSAESLDVSETELQQLEDSATEQLEALKQQIENTIETEKEKAIISQ